ncbi:hypothetical protein [Croceicoccus sp. BE223]|uniref:hypothetical protein n=1 Tax=Croceicoccus sp. BE223 TaxID=2817716 RepID=UPI0028627ADD|nr:hypothetical protein [Croceicoccus sp. BE223]MDR7103008.1 hypothetical protein [Croceicoccus sp. BE223]
MSIIDDIEIAIEPIIEEAKEWGEKALDFLKDVPITAGQKAVALIKETSLGTAIMNLISAASLKDVSGMDKFNAVFDGAVAAYRAFTENGGLNGLIASGMSVLRQLVQSLYDDFKAAFA